MARWYLAPVVMETVMSDEKGGTIDEPRPGSNGLPCVVKSMVCHVYNETDVLVGLLDERTEAPKDWTELPLDEAMKHYEQKTGSVPSSREVF